MTVTCDTCGQPVDEIVYDDIQQFGPVVTWQRVEPLQFTLRPCGHTEGATMTLTTPTYRSQETR